MRDIDTAMVDSLKVLDPNRPIEKRKSAIQSGSNAQLMRTARSANKLASWFKPHRLELRSGLLPREEIDQGFRRVRGC